MRKTIEINYLTPNHFPALGEIIEKDGKKYRVIDNSVRNVTTAEEIVEKKSSKKSCLHITSEWVTVKGVDDRVLMCSVCKLGLRTEGGKMLMTPLN